MGGGGGGGGGGGWGWGRVDTLIVVIVGAVSAPADQDAPWASYSRRISREWVPARAGAQGKRAAGAYRSY